MGKVKVPPLLPRNISNMKTQGGRNINESGGTPLNFNHVEDISQLDSVHEVEENGIRIHRLSTNENNGGGAILLPMGSVNGVLDQQFDSEIAGANLD